MSEAKMRVQASELAAIVTAVGGDGEPVGVPLRPDADTLLDFVRRLARDLAEAREREALAMSVKVQWIDDAAAARVTTAQAEAYLKRTGWESQGELDGQEWWHREHEEAAVPARPDRRDYPRRMSDLVRTLADVEQRSPIAVWLDLLAEKP